MTYPLDPDETIDSVANACGRVEQDKGFREDWALALKLEDLANRTVDGPVTMHDEEVLRQAAKALRNNYVGMKVVLVMSELAEAIETLRDHGVDGVIEGKGNFGEEMADAHIRMWALEDLLGIHSGRQVTDKIERNKDRAYRHGRVL